MYYPTNVMKPFHQRPKIWTGLLFCFQCWIFTAQPIDRATYLTLYEQSPNEKTAVALSKGLQSIANWYCEMPQYNSDSSRFYFLAAEKLLLQYNALDELLEVYRDALSTFNLYSPAEMDSIAAIAWNYTQPNVSSPNKRMLYYEILYHRAIAANKLGDRPRALQLYAKAYELVKMEDQLSTQAGLLADRGNIYLSLGDSYESEGYPYIRQSIALFENESVTKNLEKLYQNYSHMAWWYNTLDQFDSSLIYFRKEKELLNDIKDPMVHFEYYTNYGNVLHRMNRMEDAKRNLLLGYDLSNTYNMKMNSINRFNLSILGVLARDENEFDKSIDYFNQSHEIFKRMSPLGFDADNMENIALTLEKKGDFKQALQYQKRFIEEYLKFLKSLNSKTVREQELQTDLILQEKDLERKKRERNYLFIGLVITLILSGLLLLIYRRSQKRKKILEIQNKTIESQANTLRLQDINKTRFFTNVSHELRTPLTLMLGPLNSAVNSGKLDEKNKSLVDLARQNAKQLMTLVNEILDITKSESVKMNVHYEPTSIYEFFKRLVFNFESYASQRKIKLLFYIDSGLPPKIMMDTNKTERIFNNLLSNALKFTSAEGTISVKLVDNNTTWSLIVEDTGRGIHPDDLPFVFDRFYQGSQRSMSLEGGTGIGLSLSKDLALLLEGSLSAESQLNIGSKFTLKLPKTEVIGDDLKEGIGLSDQDNEINILQPGLVTTSESELIPSQPKDSTLKSSKILVVEDNFSLREYLQIILSSTYKVVTVLNGSEAITYFKGIRNPAERPDLIITDIMMPVMDGFALLEYLKSDSSLQFIPVVMLTARAGNEDRLKALRIGVDDYLTKPFEEEELLARIKNLLTNAQMRQHILKEEGITTVDNSIFRSQEDLEWLNRLEMESLLHIANANFTIDNLADQMHISRAQFFRRVQLLTGMTPLQYIQAIKYNYARSLLEQKKVNSVKAAAAAIGVAKVQYFSAQFKERFGKSPSEYLG